MAETKSRHDRSWRYTRAGSVLGSYDFFLGVPVGIVAAVAVGFSSDVRSSIAGLLIGTAGVSAAIATLVLTSLTVLLTSVSREYKSLLRQLPEGAVGITQPYRVVIKVGSVGALCSLLGAFAISVPGGLSVGGFNAGVAVAAAPGLSLTAWAILGCIQVTEQFIKHWANNDRVVELEERRQRTSARSAS